MNILIPLIVLFVSLLLIRVWTGVLNMAEVQHHWTILEIERKHPYLPKIGMVLLTLGLTALFAVMAMRYSAVLPWDLVGGGISRSTIERTIFVFLAISAFGAFDQWRWRGLTDRYRMFFAFVLGTVVTWILIGFKRAFFETGIQEDPFLMALGITCVVIGWRFLFGPWSATIKATILGTFVFWVIYALLRSKTQGEVTATALAAMIAFIPVLLWCALFLRQHRQRPSVALLALLAGMLATAPILFYDTLLKRGIQLNFFYFKITLEDFSGSSQEFTTSSFLTHGSVHTTIVATLLTYLLVGLIEEGSKYWILTHSGTTFFRSIDDALQLSIIVALGFTFAENILNPSYFVAFVKNYLITPPTVQWGPFLGNVLGRSVLTTMVHVLSTGVMGYFLGLAFFASPLLKDQFERGKLHPIIRELHSLLAVRTASIYRRTHILIGIVCAVIIHGLFDFIVSLPDILPGNPTTVGAVFGMAQTSFLSNVSLILIPSILYVVGGFWLLLYLFARTEDMKEFGAVVQEEVRVRESEVD